MSATATPAPEDLRRLARLQDDPNLRNSAARWRAHERCYPGSGAADVITPGLLARDKQMLADARELLADLREKAPGDEAIPYVEWMCAELAAEAQA